nr:transmembrane protein 68-like isoform X2 [Zootoca vivipara]
MSWFSHILENWISFPFLEEYLTSVVHPLWLLKLLILFYSPVIALLLLLWPFSFLLHIYKKMNNQQESDSKFWEKPRKLVALVTDIVGKILFGLKIFFDTIGLKDFSKAECVEILKKGHFIGISPGGAREANFSNDYSLMWGNRTGFAQIALEAKVPIIPIFTQNICEVIRNIGKTRLTRWLYEKTRLLYLPMYGPFPVKLRTYIGEPIPYDPNITAAELAEKTKIAIENLRDKYQKRPGNILRAISERFDKHYKTN